MLPFYFAMRHELRHRQRRFGQDARTGRRDAYPEMMISAPAQWIVGFVSAQNSTGGKFWVPLIAWGREA